MKKILIVGATSTIARETARLFAESGSHLFLVGRNKAKLNSISDDLRIRGTGQVEIFTMDAKDFHKHKPMLEYVVDKMGSLDIVLIAHGTLSDQKKCEESFDETLEELQINGLSFISLLTHIANYLVMQGHGTIAVISSVAGDRGRQSNYVYGSAKAALNTFLQGLRSRLYKSGVHVLTIKPGFVDTPMTVDFPKGLLWAQPETVARGIYRAIIKRRNIAYLPWFWQPIMLIIKIIPEFVFKRMRL